MRVSQTAPLVAILLTAARVAAFESIDTRLGVRVGLYGGENRVPFRSGDRLGYVLVGGDFDGDGYEDLLVSSATGDGPDHLRANASDVYIMFGRPRADVDSLYDLTQQADIALYGAREGDNMGWALASGDFDADGYDDLFLAAPFSDLPDSSRQFAGEVYIVFGRPRDQFSKVYDFKTAAPDVRIIGDGEGGAAWLLGGSSIDYQGVRSSYPVRSLAVGDINGDRFDDVLVGSPITTASLLAVWGTTSDDVYAVGVNGEFLHFDGSAWTRYAIPTRQALHTISGLSSQSVFVAGDGGTILCHGGF